MSPWREYRCPLCGWLHSRKKWRDFRAMNFDIKDWGKIRSSTGRSITDEGVIRFYEVPDFIQREIAKRTLMILGFLHQENLINDEEMIEMVS